MKCYLAYRYTTFAAPTRMADPSCVCVPHARDGYDYILWLSERMHLCVYSPLDVIAVRTASANPRANEARCLRSSSRVIITF